MPRRTKQGGFTGSLLLGAELRRLRGARSHQDIAMLLKGPPFAGKVPSVSTSTLCELEQGKTLPQLMTLYALSMVYGVSMNQLMGYVMEEQMVNSIARTGEAIGEDAEKRFAKHLAVAEWMDALAIAVHAEKLATTERARIGWRANRALCLSNVGLHDQATWLLMRCLEDPAGSPRQESALLHNLADVLATGGNPRLAGLLTRECMENMPADSAPADEAALARLSLRLTVEAEARKESPNERVLRKALRLADRAEKDCGAHDPAALVRVRCDRAYIQALLGNALVAVRDLQQVLAEAAELRYPRMEAYTALVLGHVLCGLGRAGDAEAHYARAAGVAEAGSQNDVLFEASLELFQLLRHDRPGSALAWFRRCRELAPFLPAGNPAMRAFERIVEELR